MSDLVDITKASAISGVLIYAALWIGLWPRPGYPRSVVIIDLILTIFCIGGARFLVRAYTETVQTCVAQKETLVVGAGVAGATIMRELKQNPDLDYKPIGFVDDDITKQGIRIHGKRVLGTTNDITTLVAKHGVRCVLIAIPSAEGKKIDEIINKIIEESKKIIPGENLGSVITKESKERIEKYITEAQQQGAKILVDGRNTKVEGKENGTYVGPTVIDYVTPDMSVAKEEIFGPVISIMRAKNVDEALAIENANPYGNAASVFTQNGGMARYIIDKASAGMIGVNVGVPVPREPFSFGGWNESKFGVGDITGKSSIEFWTKLKKSTIKWNPEAGVNWMS